MSTREKHRYRIRRLTTSALALIAAMSLSACGDSGDSQSDSEKTDHVWKDQTQAIDKARDVQRQLDQSRK